MDARDVTTILLKVVGLIVFSYAIFDIPAYFVGPFDGGRMPPLVGERFARAAVALLLPIVFGLLLWFFPGKVTNRIVTGPRSNGTFGTSDFERVALTILGVWLITYGAVEAMSGVLDVYLYSGVNPFAPISGVWFARTFVALFKMAIGFALVLGAPGIQRLVRRLRGEP